MGGVAFSKIQRLNSKKKAFWIAYSTRSTFSGLWLCDVLKHFGHLSWTFFCENHEFWRVFFFLADRFVLAYVIDLSFSI